MKKAEDYINDLLDYYNVQDNILLSVQLGVAQQTVSNWKTRNSVNAIKKKCRELGIYDEIFKDEFSNSSIIQSNNERAIGKIAGNNYEKVGNQKDNDLEFEELTISLVKSLINKFGEEELQFKLMELKRNES